ncbi:MAG: RNA polymerase sigma factor [Acidobacteriota bacterium]
MRTPDDRLRSLLDEYGDVVRRAILRVAPRALAPEVDDIEQEARLRIWRALDRDASIEKPASYLYRLAVHATLDAIGRLRARREESLETAPLAERASGAPSPEHAAARREELATVRRMMTRLPANRRRAVGLHLQGFTTTEIGDLLGWTEAKARNLAYRGLADLRRHLAETAAHDTERSRHHPDTDAQDAAREAV